MHLWQRLRTAHRDAPDVSRDQLFRDLLPFLPDRGPIGFQITGGYKDNAPLLAARYALAPRQVLDSPAAQFVIEAGPASGPTSLAGNSDFDLVVERGDIRVYRKKS